MSIKTQLLEHMKEALKNKDKVRLDVIRMVNAKIKDMEIELRRELNPDEVLSAINREIKQIRDTLSYMNETDHADKISEQNAKLQVLQAYLPKQLTREEIESVVKNLIVEMNVTDQKQKGRVIGEVNKRYKGQVDGRLVQEIVNSISI